MTTPTPVTIDPATVPEFDPTTIITPSVRAQRFTGGVRALKLGSWVPNTSLLIPKDHIWGGLIGDDAVDLAVDEKASEVLDFDKNQLKNSLESQKVSLTCSFSQFNRQTQGLSQGMSNVYERKLTVPITDTALPQGNFIETIVGFGNRSLDEWVIVFDFIVETTGRLRFVFPRAQITKTEGLKNEKGKGLTTKVTFTGLTSPINPTPCYAFFLRNADFVGREKAMAFEPGLAVGIETTANTIAVDDLPFGTPAPALESTGLA